MNEKPEDNGPQPVGKAGGDTYALALDDDALNPNGPPKDEMAKFSPPPSLGTP